jgi:hypothetical protein
MNIAERFINALKVSDDADERAELLKEYLPHVEGVFDSDDNRTFMYIFTDSYVLLDLHKWSYAISEKIGGIPTFEFMELVNNHPAIQRKMKQLESAKQ